MKTRRREVLLGATAAVGSCGSLPTPAIAQGIKELKMATSLDHRVAARAGEKALIDWRNRSLQCRTAVSK